MAEPQMSYEDGAAYERYMGRWSRLVGETFLEWLEPGRGLRWADVGCGSGALTELIVERCAPAAVEGVDLSEAQLAFARARPAARLARFTRADAMALPFPDASFDAAVMALVIFFVPEPAKAVAEMARVTAPGGLVATYAWDFLGGGFPLEPVRAGMRAMGLAPPAPPRVEASRMEALQELWRGAGLQALETRQIEVARTFADFEEFWSLSLLAASIRPALAEMAPADVAKLEALVRERLSPRGGPLTCRARANAIKGRVPG